MLCLRYGPLRVYSWWCDHGRTLQCLWMRGRGASQGCLRLLLSLCAAVCADTPASRTPIPGFCSLVMVSPQLGIACAGSLWPPSLHWTPPSAKAYSIPHCLPPRMEVVRPTWKCWSSARGAALVAVMLEYLHQSVRVSIRKGGNQWGAGRPISSQRTEESDPLDVSTRWMERVKNYADQTPAKGTRPKSVTPPPGRIERESPPPSRRSNTT